MKKRLLSLVLVLAMVISLFAGMTVTVSATSESDEPGYIEGFDVQIDWTKVPQLLENAGIPSFEDVPAKVTGENVLYDYCGWAIKVEERHFLTSGDLKDAFNSILQSYVDNYGGWAPLEGLFDRIDYEINDADTYALWVTTTAKTGYNFGINDFGPYAGTITSNVPVVAKFMNGRTGTVSFYRLGTITQIEQEKEKVDSGTVAIEDEQALRDAFAAGGKVTLTNDIQLTSRITIAKDVELDLAGYTITGATNENNAPENREWYVLRVENAKLTITDSSSEKDGTIQTGSDAAGKGTIPVAAMGANAVVDINGGNFISNKEEQCVYTRYGGKANIYGGTFSCIGTSGEGDLLNVYNAEPVTNIKVYGGTFVNYNPAAGDDANKGTFVAAGCYSAKSGGNYVVKAVSASNVTCAEELIEAVAAGGNIKLGANIVLDGAIYVTNVVTVDLAGYDISMSEKDTDGDGVFCVLAEGKLTLNDSSGDNSGIVNGASDGNGYDMTIWANGGEVIINGGTYKNLGADGIEPGTGAERSDMIYAGSSQGGGGTITINGGCFESEPGEKRFVLNINNTNGTIIVKGGSFKNYNPDDGDDVVSGSFVAPGYVSTVKDDVYTVALDTSRLPGARVETNDYGDVFLGGNYIEIGLSEHGSFGTSTIPTGDSWHYDDEDIRFDWQPGHTGCREDQLEVYGVGLLSDGDGWDTGDPPTTGDFFLPGGPEERWILSYKVDGQRYNHCIADRNSGNMGAWATEPTVKDESDIANGKLKAVVTGKTEMGVEIKITYSFGVDDLYYTTDVEVKNSGDKDITEVRFVRSFDPDQDLQTQGTFETYNKVICNPDPAKAGGEDNYAMVVARGKETLSGFFFLSFDNRARASHSVDFAPYSAYMSGLWDTAPETEYTYATDAAIAMAKENTNGYALVDNAVALTFDLGNMAQKGSTTLKYFSSLNPKVNASFVGEITSDNTDAAKLAAAKTAIEAALAGMTATNSTTQATIESLIATALAGVESDISGVTATVSGFAKTNATTGAAGSVTGTVTITCGEANDTVTINKTITQLPPAPSYSDDGGSYTPPTVDVPVSNDENKVDVKAEVSGKDATIKPLDNKQIEQLVGDENASGDVVIDLSDLGKTIDTAGIPKKTLEAVVDAAEDAGNDTAHLVIKLSTAELKLDDTAMRAIVDQANGDVVKFNFDDVGLGRLNKEQKEAVKDMDIRKGYEAYITVNGNRISDFKGGNVEIIVPYAVPASEDLAGFSVWYVDEQGKLEKQKSTYDGKNKWFVVSHFSDYVIVYDKDDALAGSYHNCPKDATCPIYPYTDASTSAWYHDCVHYCIDNGIMNGYGNGIFAPNGAVTRQQVWLTLARLSGANPANAAEAREWAMENGVSDGTNPTKAVTRQQFITMLYRYAKDQGYDVSVGEETNILSYTDAFGVAEYAIPAVQWGCGSGVMGGYTDGSLKPTATTTRAHLANFLQRFCETVVK